MHQAYEKLHKVCSENALEERQCQRGFLKYCAINFDLNHVPWVGRPTKVDNNEIQAFIRSYQRHKRLHKH